MVSAAPTNGAPVSEAATMTPPSSQEQQWSVDSVVSTLSTPLEANTTSPVPFFHLLERLKTTKREGWRRFNINHGESISDHMYRMSLLTMFAPPSLASRIDVQRCTRMALVHDMAEALVGDITPVDGVPKAEKSRREAETMDFICKSLLGRVPSAGTGEQIRAIWQEYEDGETLESKYVHDIDKVELLLQMVEYERAHEGAIDLQEFSYVATRIVLPEVKAWAEDILREREVFWEGIGRKHKAGLSDKLKSQQDEYYSSGPSAAKP
ncbi:hypothetical protein L228DRAFT_280701 [Xylona heveae TC161]|uniref:5'-deoxynucleotidase n=1 Tax=Xylona heveae (strain CBS 132557 / TC161) TaxID=1328760 RepID=A0A165IW40_XYLHT|nr:hypothetical protein L228DRAFT_280701 [Xylona heveae TC161]KZF25462.1 hypothetical protein L228DRAFT_280701 [Xylona heveae TC161]